MPTINLADGSKLDINAIAYVQRQGDGILVCYRENEDDEEYAHRSFEGEDAERIMAVVREFTVDPDDITPDDIAHIEHPGMSFADLLNFFRQKR